MKIIDKFKEIIFSKKDFISFFKPSSSQKDSLTKLLLQATSKEKRFGNMQNVINYLEENANEKINKEQMYLIFQINSKDIYSVLSKEMYMSLKNHILDYSFLEELNDSNKSLIAGKEICSTNINRLQNINNFLNYLYNTSNINEKIFFKNLFFKDFVDFYKEIDVLKEKITIEINSGKHHLKHLSLAQRFLSVLNGTNKFKYNNQNELLITKKNKVNNDEKVNVDLLVCMLEKINRGGSKYDLKEIYSKYFYLKEQKNNFIENELQELKNIFEKNIPLLIETVSNSFDENPQKNISLINNTFEKAINKVNDLILIKKETDKDNIAILKKSLKF